MFDNIRIPPVVKNLLIINVLFFIVTYLTVSRDNYIMVEKFSVFYFDSPLFKIWQPITYMFMHSPNNVFHIMFNMFGLFSIGSVLEDRWGSKRFLNFYFITGLGALGLQWAVQAFEVHQILGSITQGGSDRLATLAPELLSKLGNIYNSPMLGASGAIFGLFIAFGMLYPDAELYVMLIPIPLKAKYVMPCYILLELYLGVQNSSGDSVAHFAHLGGALIGFILVKLWKDKNTFYDYYE